MPHDNDYHKKYQAALTAISHGTDGPVTKFVAIYRACRYSAEHPDSVEATANALYEVLEDGVEDD